MADDDMKDETKLILQEMMEDDEGKMYFKKMKELLNLPNQQARYYVEKLEKEGLIIAPNEMASSFENEEFYYLTPKGRAYVMEKLTQNKNN